MSVTGASAAVAAGAGAAGASPYAAALNGAAGCAVVGPAGTRAALASSSRTLNVAHLAEPAGLVKEEGWSGKKAGV